MILILNAGSSSLKSGLYPVKPTASDADRESLWNAQIDWTFGPDTAELKVATRQGTTLRETHQAGDRPAVILRLLDTLWQGDTQVIPDRQAIRGVGHRVVHGGEQYQESTRITKAVKAAIAQLTPLAPTHHPAHLEGIAAVEQVLGSAIPQVAVFDTAFHAQMPPFAALYPGPYAWKDQGIRRYGFHGISHQYCAGRVAQLIGRSPTDLRLVTCHLGNGCSLAAIRNGRSIDTTMGYTPLDGVMMGTRSGAVDPGILIHLLRQGTLSVAELNHLLNQDSGLKGISGVSNDLRQIYGAIAEGNSRAQLAYDMFIHSLRKALGSMIASLGGVDAIAFTAGIGENDPAVRAAVCSAFEFMGVILDPNQNRRSPEDLEISAAGAKVRVFALHTQEDWEIAQECRRLLFSVEEPA
jgi:acetate kinase